MMVLYLPDSGLIINAVVVILVVGVIEANESSQCQGSCGSKPFPYPFGFSRGCPIRLNCTDGLVKIGKFAVQNVSSRGILVSVPSDCHRRITDTLPLFSDHYAPSRHNSLLLQRCWTQSGNCLIKPDFVQSQLNRSSCGSGLDISCFSLDQNSTTRTDGITYEHVNRSNCLSLFSSIAFQSGGERSTVSLDFERLQLDWWLKEGCRNHTCSDNAICEEIYLGAHRGFGHRHRCSCPDGFTGDGYAQSKPCRRVSECHGSNFMRGHCKRNKIGVLVGGTLGGFLLIIVLAVAFYCLRRRYASMKSLSSAKRLVFEAAGRSSVPFLPYKEMEKATNGFSEKQRLGTGAYGTVYAGKLGNDEWVAIKRLRHRDADSIDQVMNEIKLLSSVSHPNLVRLLGCCIEQGEPVLVYEFMPNGTLSQHLQRERGNGLPWAVRLTIATQTAKAITYLHSAMNPPIYHRDIKSSNILLDYKFNSKVADFGLSRLGMAESSHISTAPQGTPGYLDPQYHQYFHLSDKSDVYSFGVVLVEIITALKVVDFNRPHSEVNLAALAIDRIGRGFVDEIIDPYLEPNQDAWTLSSIHNVAELAFRCLAFHRDMRPTMMEVAEELEQIRLSAWMPSMRMESPTSSQRSFSGHGSQRSMGSVSAKKGSVGSRSLVVPQKEGLEALEELHDSSPVSVQDPWQSEQSSPSANSLLGNVGR